LVLTQYRLLAVTCSHVFLGCTAFAVVGCILIREVRRNQPQPGPLPLYLQENLIMPVDV
jgi:hypothetical protein